LNRVRIRAFDPHPVQVSVLVIHIRAVNQKQGVGVAWGPHGLQRRQQLNHAPRVAFSHDVNVRQIGISSYFFHHGPDIIGAELEPLPARQIDS